MSVKDLLKRGNSKGLNDPIFILALALDDLQHENVKLKKRITELEQTANNLDHRTIGLVRIGGGI